MTSQSQTIAILLYARTKVFQQWRENYCEKSREAWLKLYRIIGYVMTRESIERVEKAVEKERKTSQCRTTL